MIPSLPQTSFIPSPSIEKFENSKILLFCRLLSVTLHTIVYTILPKAQGYSIAKLTNLPPRLEAARKNQAARLMLFIRKMVLSMYSNSQVEAQQEDITTTTKKTIATTNPETISPKSTTEMLIHDISVSNTMATKIKKTQTRKQKKVGKYVSGNGKYQDLCDKLAIDLIPPSGKSSTLGGEMLRCVMKLNNEFFRNQFRYDVSGCVLFLRENLDLLRSDSEVDEALKFLSPMVKKGQYAYSVSLPLKSKNSASSSSNSSSSTTTNKKLGKQRRKQITDLIGYHLDTLINAVMDFNLKDEKRSKQINKICWTDFQLKTGSWSSSQSFEPDKILEEMKKRQDHEDDDDDHILTDFELQENRLFLFGSNLKSAFLSEIDGKEEKDLAAAAATIKKKKKKKTSKRKLTTTTTTNSASTRASTRATTSNKKKKPQAQQQQLDSLSPSGCEDTTANGKEIEIIEIID